MSKSTYSLLLFFPRASYIHFCGVSGLSTIPHLLVFSPSLSWELQHFVFHCSIFCYNYSYNEGFSHARPEDFGFIYTSAFLYTIISGFLRGGYENKVYSPIILAACQAEQSCVSMESGSVTDWKTGKRRKERKKDSWSSKRYQILISWKKHI